MNQRITIKRVTKIEEISIEDVGEVPDESLEPTAVLRAKAERLGEYLGITADDAERLIFERL